MSSPADTVKNTSQSVPESPTTARPLEMDDDDIQESGIVAAEDNATNTTSTNQTMAQNKSAAAAPANSEEVPPTKPPRPVTEAQKNMIILREAFPNVEIPVIKAVLSASRGEVEAAFHALLEMTDPDAVKDDEATDELPPPKPPRPASGTVPLSQVEADELYARQLAEHYENTAAYEERTSSRGSRPRQRQETGLKPNEMWGDKDHSFIDDDLPVIRENLRKGFIETQSRVNTWITNLKKKIDETFDEEGEGSGSGRGSGVGIGGGRPSQYNRRSGDIGRRSGDYERYDADPHVITDDFAGMKLGPDGTPIRDTRSPGNPDLFRPPPPSKSPKPSGGRRVAFREHLDEVDMYDTSPRTTGNEGTGTQGSAGKTSKWQPLTPVEPNPITDNDPFTLGDSEDERDTKDKPAPVAKDIKMEDSERLKKAAAEAMADSLVDSKGGEAKKD